MAVDWAADVKKYAPKADDAVIAGIVRYCGIALTKPDSALVAMSDKKETDRVRENFLKKKLGRTESDAELDAAIAAVGDTMKADRTKNRVTVYYLLADKFGSTGLFVKATNAKAKAPAKAVGAAADKKPAAKISTKTTKAPTKPKAKTTGAGAGASAGAAAAGGAALGLAALGNEASGGAPASAANDEGVAAKAGAALGAAGAAVTGATEKVADVAGDAVGAAGDAASKAGAAVAGAAGAAAAGAAALASGAGNAVSGGVDRASKLVGSSSDEAGDSNWLWWLLGGLLVLFAIWWFFLHGKADSDSAAQPVAIEESAPAASTAPSGELAAAPAEGTVAIPAGAGVTSELRDGKPVVKVYFDTGKTDVVPDFTATAGGLKAWLESHAGSSLAVSGYADPSGNAALNAALSKKRAQAVQAALVAAGIPEASAALVKPAETTDATVDKAAARRVEVVVR